MVDYLEINFLDSKVTSKQTFFRELGTIFQVMVPQYEVKEISASLLRVHLQLFKALINFGVLDLSSVLRLLEIFCDLFRETMDRLNSISKLSEVSFIDDLSFFFKISFEKKRQAKTSRLQSKRSTFQKKNDTIYRLDSAAVEKERSLELTNNRDYYIFLEILRLLIGISDFVNFVLKVTNKMLLFLYLHFFKQSYINDPDDSV